MSAIEAVVVVLISVSVGYCMGFLSRHSTKNDAPKTGVDK